MAAVAVLLRNIENAAVTRIDGTEMGFSAMDSMIAVVFQDLYKRSSYKGVVSTGYLTYSGTDVASMCKLGFDLGLKELNADELTY